MVRRLVLHETERGGSDESGGVHETAHGVEALLHGGGHARGGVGRFKVHRRADGVGIRAVETREFVRTARHGHHVLAACEEAGGHGGADAGGGARHDGADAAHAEREIRRDGRHFQHFGYFFKKLRHCILFQIFKVSGSLGFGIIIIFCVITGECYNIRGSEVLEHGLGSQGSG